MYDRPSPVFVSNLPLEEGEEPVETVISDDIAAGEGDAGDAPRSCAIACPMSEDEWTPSALSVW